MASSAGFGAGSSLILQGTLLSLTAALLFLFLLLSIVTLPSNIYWHDPGCRGRDGDGVAAAVALGESGVPFFSFFSFSLLSLY